MLPTSDLDAEVTAIEVNSSECPLILTSSLSADVSVKLPPSYKVDKSFYSLAALGAARFILDVRGVPLNEIDVEIGGEIFRVARTGNDGKLGVKMPKCKELASNIQTFVGVTDVNVSDYIVENTCVRLLECSDVRTLSPDCLKSLLLSGERTAELCAGFCRKEEVSLLLAGLVALSPGAVIKAITAISYAKRMKNGESLSFLYGENRLSVCSFGGNLMLFTYK